MRKKGVVVEFRSVKNTGANITEPSFVDRDIVEYNDELKEPYKRGMIWNSVGISTVSQLATAARKFYSCDQEAGNEIAMLMKGQLQWHEMSKKTQDMLFYRHAPEMPYGTAKAKSEDPDEWILNRLPFFLKVVGFSQKS